MKLGKYSLGTGDRFGRQGKSQLEAVRQAGESGIELDIVWNKSHREHTIIGTTQDSVRKEADEAVAALGWEGAYFVDADHIGLDTVDVFVGASDFFTLDVADFIGKAAPAGDIDAFVGKHSARVGKLDIPGIDRTVTVTKEKLRAVAETFLLAVQEAGRIYRHIVEQKGEGMFVTEVSMDETHQPQSPEEMMFILAAIADEGIPIQTIAPKFSGRFNKGVDYVGDGDAFVREFEDDICVVGWAVGEFGLPDNLKLSVHSGSDKFSLYAGINSVLKAHDAGIHLKTAGTTWLEELIGLAEAGGGGAWMVKEVYETALERFDELCAPYATVIDIDRAALPSPEALALWSGEDMAGAIRHHPPNPAFDPNVRQLLHVGYKVAAEMGPRYLELLEQGAASVRANVIHNLLARHILPLFG
ncbi:MAG: hypothetical protein HQ559_02500 [Lentisphaerae bacterium]|nr:hypothetical protein [Lentisphaerota bacterium]